MAREPADVLRDPTRLAVLRETELLDTPPEEAFDRLTRLASRVLGTPLAMVTLVDGDRQFCKSAAGGGPLTEVREVPLAQSFCRHAVESGRELVIADTRADPRVREMLPDAPQGIGAYLGVPLVTRDGVALGTLCVCDYAPRAWNAGDVALLRDVAAVVTLEMERRRADAATRATEETLIAAETMFRALVEQSLAGIAVVEGRRVVYVNPRLAEIFGRSREEMVAAGRVLDLVAPEDRGGVSETAMRLTAGDEGDFRRAFRVLRADGEQVHVEVHGTPAQIEGRRAVVALVLDISERVRAEQEREAAVAARDRFYAMLSHELRTPLSAILLYHELLATQVYGPMTPAQEEAVERAQRSARHLLELINDLLDLSKLRAGKMDWRVEDVDLADLVENVFLAVAPLAAENRCELSLQVSERPLLVLGDARRVRQVVLNLLSNAVKYGHWHPVEVRCGRTTREVVVEVVDRGPGIAVEDQARIFDDFVQLGDGSREGTGLGLPISRRLAELMGGRLEVESAVGEGSTFRLVLPRGELEP